MGRGRWLAVVHGIVRAHGGAINVVSGPNQGTTFQILLPCAGKPAKRDRSAIVPTPNERAPSTVGTVLLVEDEDSLRVPVSKMLRKNGLSIVEAADGSAAVELFHGHQANIDVILLDMTIPGASSRDVVAEVLRIRPDIRIILMSAYSREEVTSSLDAPQVTKFIRKPFHLGDLVQLLQDTLSS